MDKAFVNPRPIPILTYHSIDDSGSVVSTSPAIFREQMRYLSDAGFNVISVGEVVTHLTEGRPVPHNTAAIAFDDGYENVYTEAFPIMQQYGFKGTVFLIADYCGKRNDWPGNDLALGRRPLLSWSEVREMHRHRIEFGAHTLTHPDLTRLNRPQAEQEIRGSKNKIEDRLGDDIAIFAYPYGRYNAAAKEIAQRHFRGACSTRLGKVDSGSDLFLLERVDMYYLSDLGFFSKLATTRLSWYLAFRQVLRDLKSLTLNNTES